MSDSISRDELLAVIETALRTADDPVRAAWERIRIEPQRWSCGRHGSFWAVAIDGPVVYWFNDIEEGFQTSPFSRAGEIGEYLCSDDSLSQLLARFPEAVAADTFAAAAPGDLPGGARGPGRIARRQTTYWDLVCAMGDVRAHFSGKLEARFATADYESAQLFEEHPVLVAHHEPWADVYFRAPSGTDVGFDSAFADAVSEASRGWRTAGEYLAHGGAGVESAHGLLMRAPMSIARLAERLMPEYGMVPSVVIGARTPPARSQALILGQSFVVAAAFRFVVREQR